MPLMKKVLDVQIHYLCNRRHILEHSYQHLFHPCWNTQLRWSRFHKIWPVCVPGSYSVKWYTYFTIWNIDTEKKRSCYVIDYTSTLWLSFLTKSTISFSWIFWPSWKHQQPREKNGHKENRTHLWNSFLQIHTTIMYVMYVKCGIVHMYQSVGSVQCRYSTRT